MAELHCCLAGFDGDETLKLESLAGLLRSQLSADWSFNATVADACDLLLCDLESAPGAAAWRDNATRIRLRAAATSGPAVLDGLTMRKPLRVHGPDGLLHVLNEAARIGQAPASPALAASGPAADGTTPSTLAKPDEQRPLLRAAPSGPSGSDARPSASRPPEMPANACPVGDAAEPLPPHGCDVPLDTPVQKHAADPGFAAPTPAAGGEVVPYRPDSHLTHRTPPMPGCTAPAFDAEGCDLLGLLRRARAASQVVVFRLSGAPAICAAPASEIFYTLATLQAVFDSPAAALVPTGVTVARNSHHGRTEAQAGVGRTPVSLPGLPLKDLFWVATLRCGGADEVARYGDGTFSLPVWPDLVNLPHARHHFTWCNLLARQPVTAAALAEATGHEVADAAIFLAACDELGILMRKEPSPSPAPASPVPASRVLERTTVFRSILNRLGLKWP